VSKTVDVARRLEVITKAQTYRPTLGERVLLGAVSLSPLQALHLIYHGDTAEQELLVRKGLSGLPFPLAASYLASSMTLRAENELENMQETLALI